MGLTKPTPKGVELPELSNPATADKILSGYEAVDGTGNKLTGTSTAKVLPSLSNPAGAGQILSGYQAINSIGNKVTGTMEKGFNIVAGDNYKMPIVTSTISTTSKTEEHIATIKANANGSIKLVVNLKTGSPNECHIYVNGSVVLYKNTTTATTYSVNINIVKGQTYTIGYKSTNSSYYSYINTLDACFSLDGETGLISLA